MKFSNAMSFKARIKQIAKEKQVPAQQIQQTYLIEQVLKLISQSTYRDHFIVKGGYLIGQLIGIDKRTTMDLDVTLKGQPLNKSSLLSIFEFILVQQSVPFTFEIDKLEPIRESDEYGGFSLKLNATFETLKETVYLDITTGDKITPKEITYKISSLFDEDKIEVWSYNLETLLAEKLETVISRGVASTRPRDRYDLYSLYKLRKQDIGQITLRQALQQTTKKRGTEVSLLEWQQILSDIRNSAYQRQLWSRYQRSFKYAREISFEESVDVVAEILDLLEGK